MTPAELLLIHAGHRTTIVEPTPRRSLALKCFTCDGRLTDLSGLVGLRPSTGRTTSTSNPPTRRDPKGDEQCPAHTGEWREACRCCAAEAKALPDGTTRPSTVRTGTDPAAVPEVAAAKARLAELARTREARQRAHLAALASPPVSPPGSTLDHDQQQTAGGTP